MLNDKEMLTDKSLPLFTEPAKALIGHMMRIPILDENINDKITFITIIRRSS